MSTRQAAGLERGLPPSCPRDRAQRARSRTATPPLTSPEAWSDAAVEQLHEGLLRHALQALHTRGHAALKREVLRWIFCPQPMVLMLPDPQGRLRAAVLPQDCTPFSFEQCCRICGYSSERLMDGLKPVLSAMGLGNVFNEIANGSNHYLNEPDAEVL